VANVGQCAEPDIIVQRWSKFTGREPERIAA